MENPMREGFATRSEVEQTVFLDMLGKSGYRAGIDGAACSRMGNPSQPVNLLKAADSAPRSTLNCNSRTRAFISWFKFGGADQIQGRGPLLNP